MSVTTYINEEAKEATFQISVNDVVVSEYILNVNNSTIHVTPLLNDVFVSFVDHKKNIELIETWINNIENIFVLDKTKPNRTKQNYIKRPNELEGNFRVLDYLFDVEYRNINGEITVKARLENNFTWKSFVYFVLYHRKFILEAQYGFPGL